MTAICLSCRVLGRVQGVFYRRFCAEQAQKFGVTGWVKNKNDGSVELLICGEQSNLDAMILELKQGPPRADVQEVQLTEIPFQKFNQFEVKIYD